MQIRTLQEETFKRVSDQIRVSKKDKELITQTFIEVFKENSEDILEQIIIDKVSEKLDSRADQEDKHFNKSESIKQILVKNQLPGFYQGMNKVVKLMSEDIFEDYNDLFVED